MFNQFIPATNITMIFFLIFFAGTEKTPKILVIMKWRIERGPNGHNYNREQVIWNKSSVLFVF